MRIWSNVYIINKLYARHILPCGIQSVAMVVTLAARIIMVVVVMGAVVEVAVGKVLVYTRAVVNMVVELLVIDV